MIVWGSKGEVEYLGPQVRRHCQVCEKEQTFRLRLQYKVNHIWYIFKWVSERQYAVVCDVCNRGERLLAEAVESKLGEPPIPFMSRWGWAFLVGLIGFFVVFGAVDSSIRSSRVSEFIATPKKNDIYVVDVSRLLQSPGSVFMYGLLRIRSVNGDQVEFDAPTVTYNGITGSTRAAQDLRNGRLTEPSYFATTPIVLSREQIGQLQKWGAIDSIERE